MTVTSIGKASGEKVTSVGSEAWNIADGYTKIKILRLLIELDLHETIAKFGRKDQEEATENIAEKRIEAINRLVFSLKQLIGNCKFSINKKNMFVMENLLTRIRAVENVLGGIYYENFNEVTKQRAIIINESHFNLCLDILRQIKDELNIPINEAGLIFKNTDDIDIDSMMKTIIEGG